ncbi:MAG TPA: hypothetical protein VNA69_20985 [Thermoanaerobaculia bacterium]|nr:hypothetical protein [Thermoanaerobaculia bacterium]
MDARKQERGKAIAAKLTQRPVGDRFIVTDARVFDPRSGTLSEPTMIVVEGNRIVSVGEGTERSAATLIKADGKVVLNEEDARKAVDFFAGRGYEGLKIYSSIKPELVPVLTRYAHEKGCV